MDEEWITANIPLNTIKPLEGLMNWLNGFAAAGKGRVVGSFELFTLLGCINSDIVKGKINADINAVKEHESQRKGDVNAECEPDKCETETP